VTKLTEKPFVDVTRLTCDLHGRHNIAVDTTRSLTSTSDPKRRFAMVTLLLVAAVGSYLLVAAYALSWPATMPH
jgi:hypothetical protein